VLFIDIVNMDVTIRIQAHASLINSILKVGDLIVTSSEDGHINKLKLVDNTVVVFAPSKMSRLLTGMVVINKVPYAVCYEYGTLTELA
jgi:hypothetical protein